MSFPIFLAFKLWVWNKKQLPSITFVLSETSYEFGWFGAHSDEVIQGKGLTSINQHCPRPTKNSKVLNLCLHLIKLTVIPKPGASVLRLVFKILRLLLAENTTR
jgi:hypothetical protein